MISRAYIPTQPINQKALFAGRHNEVGVILDAIGEPGRHVILYGERGVGKTSFANVLQEFLEEKIPKGLFIVIKVTANSDDTFSTIWHEIARKIVVKAENPRWFLFSQETGFLTVYCLNIFSTAVVATIFIHNRYLHVDEFDQSSTRRRLLQIQSKRSR
jgi:Cdc6-like AAA superfamily ATPase